MVQFSRIGGPRSLAGNLRSAASKGVNDAAEHLLSVARSRTPRDEGTLQRSGAVTARDTEAVVSFDTPYAVRQHEELTWNHPRGGQAKYLESAMIDESETMARIIQAQIERGMSQ